MSQLLSENVIKVDLESEAKEEVFSELIELLVRDGKITDRAAALNAIETREELGTTGIGKGVAIPHGKDTCIGALTAALGISRNGIEYDAIDDEPVHLVFLVLAEPENPGPHVQCLAEVARLLQVPGFYKRLVAASTTKDILDAISAEE